MYEIFERLCNENGVTAYRVAKETGISTATFSNWKAGRSTPKTDKLQLIADFFGVPLETFTGKKKKITAEFHKHNDAFGRQPTADPVDLVAKKPLLNYEQKDTDLRGALVQMIYGTIPSGSPVYYQNAETARLAQEMFEDEDMRALFHMKKGMEPEKFAAHMKMMKELYRLEHPEEFPEDSE